jgi:hypothetical protein
VFKENLRWELQYAVEDAGKQAKSKIAAQARVKKRGPGATINRRGLAESTSSQTKKHKQEVVPPAEGAKAKFTKLPAVGDTVLVTKVGMEGAVTSVSGKKLEVNAPAPAERCSPSNSAVAVCMLRINVCMRRGHVASLLMVTVMARMVYIRVNRND